jgi:diaminopimelate decarboxylase
METLALFPLTARIDEDGRLWLGGCLASSLADEFGTPLYVFDEATLRARCQAYRRALAEHYPGPGQVAYASKAYLNLALAQIFEQEGLHLDVVSSGELYVARQAGYPGGRIHFHGNNKSAAELAMALDEGVGRIVVDNFHELDELERLVAGRRHSLRWGGRAAIWLRCSPGVEAHTHTFNQTGALDSKFGFALETGDAERALARAMHSPYLDLLGVHMHIGSQILDVEPWVAAISLLMEFAAAMRTRYGFQLREFSPGGGWGVPYHEDDPAAPPERFVQAAGQALVESCRRYGLALPDLTIEPGRSIVAPAGVALYRVGARKEIPGVRTYVAVDGGMADNIRPALYAARYTALAIDQARRPAEEVVTVVGRFCESGDVLIRDIALPRLAAGDVLAVPMAGAYCLAMASTYNLVPRLAAALVDAGRAQLIQRRETLRDLLARDLPLGGEGE